MPRIIVIADESNERITHSERVSPADFDTEHFRQQLAERVAWAVQDAADSEPRVLPRSEDPRLLSA